MQDLNDYIEHQDYGKDNMPGVCYGFQIKEFANNSYELDLIFNDLWPTQYRSLPN